MKTNTKATLAALAVSLSFGAALATTSDPAQPVMVASVICDNEYGNAMEKAILGGDIKLVDRLLQAQGKSINDVIAISGREDRWRLSDKKAILDSRRYDPPKVDPIIFDGEVYDNTPFIPAGGPFGQNAMDISPFAPPQGDYYAIYGDTKCYVLGTPLMIAARAHKKYMVRALLQRGANPNVFIKVGDYFVNDKRRLDSGNQFLVINATADAQMKRACGMTGRDVGTWKCRRSYLCALFDCYVAMDARKVDKADEIANLLIEHGATFISGTDDMGRNALWDAARLKSAYLFGEMVKRGLDVNQEDTNDKTVFDYCAEESRGPDRTLLARFRKAVARLGVKPKERPEGADDEEDTAETAVPGEGRGNLPWTVPSRVLPQPQMTYTPMPFPAATGPSPMQKPDNSAEIAMLQNRIWALRSELEDAKANTKVSIAQGTGWVSASMRETDIMREISECERRIMQLR